MTTTRSHSAAAAAAVTPCPRRAVAALAGSVGVGVSAVHTRVTRDNSSQPECVFTVSRRRLHAWVSVSSEPQPYAVLERQAEETAQIFGGKRLTPAPVHINRLGIDADWFPALDQVLTTDGVHLITATIVRWPHVPRARWQALGIAMARPYLGRSRPDLARGPSPCGDCGGADQIGPSTTTTSSG